MKRAALVILVIWMIALVVRAALPNHAPTKTPGYPAATCEGVHTSYAIGALTTQQMQDQMDMYHCPK